MTTAMTAAAAADQISAIEIFLENLVILMEAECADFTIAKLDQWLDLCTQRMIATGSTSPGTIGALWAMQARVLGV